MKPYYEDATSGITIYHGDAEDVMASMPAASTEIVFTSPPYNKGIRWEGTWHGPPSRGGKANRFRDGYGKHDDAMPIAEYHEWQRRILVAAWRTVADNGAIFYNHKPRVINGEIWLPLTLNPGLPLRQIIVWHTGGGVNFMPGAYLPAHEWIMMFAKPNFRLSSASAVRESDVWVVPPAPAVAHHPCPFPLELPLRAIRTSGAQTVLDPFVGTGTTMEAAKMCGVRGIGIDNDEQSCEFAARRLSQGVLFGAGASA